MYKCQLAFKNGNFGELLHLQGIWWSEVAIPIANIANLAQLLVLQMPGVSRRVDVGGLPARLSPAPKSHQVLPLWESHSLSAGLPPPTQSSLIFSVRYTITCLQPHHILYMTIDLS